MTPDTQVYELESLNRHLRFAFNEPSINIRLPHPARRQLNDTTIRPAGKRDRQASGSKIIDLLPHLPYDPTRPQKGTGLATDAAKASAAMHFGQAIQALEAVADDLAGDPHLQPLVRHALI